MDSSVPSAVFLEVSEKLIDYYEENDMSSNVLEISHR